MKYPFAALLALFLVSCSKPFDNEALSVGSPGVQKRKIQRSGSIDLKSRSLQKSSEKAVALAAQHQALVTSSALTKDDFRATFHVPSSSLSPLMTSLSEVGKVTHSRVAMTDVTEAYADLLAAIQNKRALRDRLRALLARATQIEDILKIEQELSRVQTELDQMEARGKTMKSKVDLSTLTLSIERARIPGPLGAVSGSTGWLFDKLNYLN